MKFNRSLFNGLRGLSPAFIDLFAILVLILLLIPHNPKEDEDGVIDSSGDLIISAEWCTDEVDRGCTTDVDLWVKSPDDIVAVGFPRLRGSSFSLVRDDLGEVPNNRVRFERFFSREIPNGEYIVNLHLYSDKSNKTPLDVNVSIMTVVDGIKSVIWQGTETLEREDEEITVVRFYMNEGKLVPNSIHYTYKSIRFSAEN